MKIQILTVILTILPLTIFGTLTITAAPGDLDTTFGNGGKVITPGIGAISDIAIQPDGKIVAVGGARIVRYNTNGSLDSSFGTGGIVVIQLGDNISVGAYSAEVQADGKIVVACGTTGDGYAVFRYNPNGTLDTTFNGTGKIFNPNQGGFASAVAIQPDGKIVVTGVGRNGLGLTYSVVFRYHSNGTPDISFNGTGSIITPESRAFSLAIQPDGKIIVGGDHSDKANPLGYHAIFRYNADGSPDTSFGDAGRVFSRSDLLDIIWSHVSHVAIQPDGKIVAKVVGVETSDFGEYPFTLIARYNPNGSNDGIFFEVFHNPFENANPLVGDMAIQPDGKIVTVGNKFTSDRDFAVARYYPHGLPDATFNDRGFVTTDFGSDEEASAVAIQADGKIVAAGVVSSHFALARYQGGSRTRFDFDGDGRADVSVFRPSDRIWYLNQSTAGFSATQFGLATDKITPADFDGDGRTDISVYRDGVWYWLKSSNQTVGIVQFGLPSDIPVPADYSGDGRAELAIYRGGEWWTLNLTNNQVSVMTFGLANDKPVVADYDGDGRADQAVYRNGEWHLKRSSQGYTVIHFGLSTDKPVVGDYDGDGRADEAVYRDGVWYVLRSSQGFIAFQFGLSTDTPAPADYDGDGKADAAVYRSGTWWILQSTSGLAVQQFGLPDDKPVPSAFLP